MRRRYWISMTIVFLGVLLVSVSPGLAQQNTCSALVEQVLVTLGGNCGSMEVNSACYGSTLVNATFTRTVPPETFTRPGDKEQLAVFKTIQAVVNNQQWGIAVLNLLADLPETTPGQPVNILLIGNTAIENAGTSSAASPMQSFYFRTGIGPSECKETPSIFAVRSPENVQVNLTGNGANINLASIAILRVLPPGNTLQVITVRGKVTLEKGTPDQVVVPEGYQTLRCLSQPDDLGVDGEKNDQNVIPECKWITPTPATADELALGELVLKLFSSLDGCANGGQTIVHTVVRGENLFRIARRYSTTIQAIVTENNIANPTAIFPGQQLTISCAIDTGLSSIAPAVGPVVVPLTGAATGTGR